MSLLLANHAMIRNRATPGAGNQLFVSNTGSGDLSGSSASNAMPAANLQDNLSDNMTVYIIGDVDFTDVVVAAPELSMSNLLVGQIGSNDMVLKWDSGDEEFTLVVQNATGPVQFVPQDDTLYQPGQDLGNGDFAVFITGHGVAPISGLTPDSTYHFKLFGYNVDDKGKVLYRTTGQPTISETTFITQYQAVLTYAADVHEVPPSIDIQKAENNALKLAVTSGLLAQVPRLYNFYTKHDSLFWKGINLKSPDSTTQIDWSNVASIPSGGVQFFGTASDSFADPNFIPSSHHGGLVTATDFGVAFEIDNTDTAGRVPYGNWDQEGPAHNHIFIGSTATIRLNCLGTTGSVNAPNAQSAGAWKTRVKSANNGRVTRDSTVIFDGASTGIGVALPNEKFYIGARHNDGTADGGLIADMYYWMVFKHSTVTDQMIDDWFAALKSAMDAI